MTHRSWRPLAAAGAAAIALGVLGAGAPAVAETATPETVTTTAAMISKGFDAKVAEAHGFKIVTAADGTQSSIPVTAAAKAALAASKLAGVHVLNTVPGSCGTSTVTAVYEGNAKVKVATGYTVKLVSVESHWNVDAVPASTGKVGHTFNFSGLAHSTTWAGQPQTATIAYSGSGEDAQVRLGSYALLIGGEACYSAGPYDVW